MSGINVQISVSNLTQLDQHQNDQHRLPVVHHDQNAETVNQDAHKRISMPIEPDAVEKKKIDQRTRILRDRTQKRKKKKKEGKNDSREKKYRRGKSDHLIDYEA